MSRSISCVSVQQGEEVTDEVFFRARGGFRKRRFEIELFAPREIHDGSPPPRAEHPGDLREGRCPGSSFTRLTVAHKRGRAMSKLRETSEQYRQLRRELGYKLPGPGRLLQNFVAFAEREAVDHVTTNLALRWAQQPPSAQPATWAARLGVVRRRRCGRVSRDRSSCRGVFQHTAVEEWRCESLPSRERRSGSPATA